MSSTYNLEPPPTAKVLLQTTAGDIELELFAKQTPLASRNFLQLCLDGYYNGTIFHRLVPGFIIQGGDPTGTGQGGEAIYDSGLFADEFHSRLKFNRRGLLGMANSGQRDDNGSQFFLTLGKTEELNGRNTMFGRVVGDTIYNLMKMGEADLTEEEGSERPLFPAKVTGAEILVNPFDDMVKREKVNVIQSRETESGKKKTKKRPAKTLLSFGVEEGDEGTAPIIKKPKMNTKLVTADIASGTASPKTRPLERSERPLRRRSPSPPVARPVAKVDSRVQLPLPDEEVPSRSPSSSPDPPQVRKMTSLLEQTNAQIAELKASMKRTIAPAASDKSRKMSALEQMIPENATRGRRRKQGNQDMTSNDAQALKMLDAFRAKLDQTSVEGPVAASPNRTGNADSPQPVEDVNGENDEEAHLCDLHFIADCQSCNAWDKHAGGDADGDDENDKGWMSHTLSFEKDRLGKDLTWKRKTEEELVVIDPREKAKDIKEERRANRPEKGRVNSTWRQDADRGRLPQRLAGSKA